ncbi:MAG: NADH dehydrogenase [Clostridiales bacterium]|nr:NADH dehydrogenase [Clostridiales bacterium]
MQGNVWLMIAAALPMLGAPVAYGLGRGRPRRALLIMAAVSAATLALLSVLLVQTIQGQTSAFAWAHFSVMGLALAADGFTALLSWLAALLFTVAAMFSLSYFKNKTSVPRYAFFTLTTLSAVIGVFLSDQLLTTIVFFEVMSLVSYPWVAHEETPGALRAAQTYLWIAVIGGLCLLIGMLLLPHELLSLRYSMGFAMTEGIEPSRLMLPAALMLVGFGAKAGAFPLHVWLPKAHPVAPAPASALLSGMLLKTGVFGIALLSVKFLREIAAWHALIFWIGVITMVVGAVLALLAVEMKRILACSSMSQIGFIMLGVGLFGLLLEHGGGAMQGFVSHMVNHALFKLILFLCAGAVAMRRHSLNLNDIRGFGRGKPLLHALFLAGMLGITGVPLFPGFASKTLLHEALTEYIHLSGGAWTYAATEWLFILTGALTVAYMLKLYVCLFWERGAEDETKNPSFSKGSAALLSLCAAAVLAVGLFPSAILGGIGRLSAGFFHVEVEPIRVYTTEALANAVISIGVGLLIYLLAVRVWLSEKTADGRVYVDRKPTWMDLEETAYRPLMKGLTAAVGACFWLVASLPELAIAGGRRMLLHVRAWRVPMPGGNRFTMAVGGFLNGAVALLNKTVRRRRPFEIDFSAALAAGNEELGQSMRKIKRSMSYSLLLFCLGLFGLLMYLMLW